MNRSIIVALAALLAASFVVGCDSNPGADPQAQPTAAPTASPTNGFDKMPPVGAKAVCPIMGKAFTVDEKTEFSVHQGKTYVFCCPGCKPKFEAEPAKYIGG